MSTTGSLTREQLRATVLAALGGIAPEVDPAAIRPDAPLREQFDLDSMDFLNFLIAVQRDVGVDIPEADYAQVATLDACVAYLLSHQAASA